MNKTNSTRIVFRRFFVFRGIGLGTDGLVGLQYGVFLISDGHHS